MQSSKRILSGVQPSGELHLGKYLGAIKNFVAEDMTVDEMVESAEKLTEYDDGQENYFSQEKWSRC